ncbi:ATP-binding protein [Flavobacteriales bacterium]|nr:ATP-binding protein [Flavobacteriales bacterium]
MKKFIFIFIIHIISVQVCATSKESKTQQLDSIRKKARQFSVENNLDSLQICFESIKAIVVNMSGKEMLEYEKDNLLNSLNLKSKLKIEKSKSQLQSLILLLASILGFIYLIYYTDKNSRKEKLKKIHAAKNISSYEMLIKNKASEKLHDDIGGSLAALKMRLTQLNDSQYNSALKDEIKILDNIYDQVRNLSKDLNVKNKFSNNLEEILDNLVEEMCSSFQNIELNIFPKEKLNSIKDQEFINAISLTIKELITNVIKHAKAQNITLELTAHEDSVILIISDDGIGFNNNKYGLGLKNINNRAILYEGEMTIDSNPKKGTTVTVNFSYIYEEVLT